MVLLLLFEKTIGLALSKHLSISVAPKQQSSLLSTWLSSSVPSPSTPLANERNKYSLELVRTKAGRKSAVEEKPNTVFSTANIMLDESVVQNASALIGNDCTNENSDNETSTEMPCKIISLRTKRKYINVMSLFLCRVHY